MKKEKLFNNKKRGQGFAEYALLAGGMIIIIALAMVAIRQTNLFDNVGRYIRCLLRVAASGVGTGNRNVNFAGCNNCLRTGGSHVIEDGGPNLCADN